MITLSLSYPNLTCLNSMFPLTFLAFNFFFKCFSSSISSSSTNSNTLSAAAQVDCSDVIPCAIWDNGDVNNLTYNINATITPKLIFPFIVRSAPTTHTATYPKLPIKFIIDGISPDKNWLIRLHSNTFSFNLSNFFSLRYEMNISLLYGHLIYLILLVLLRNIFEIYLK